MHLDHRALCDRRKLGRNQGSDVRISSRGCVFFLFAIRVRVGLRLKESHEFGTDVLLVNIRCIIWMRGHTCMLRSAEMASVRRRGSILWNSIKVLFDRA